MLEPEEYYYARKALRGGMTNTCKYIHEGRLHYQDIQSSYPSVQMDAENLYPVGPPTIEIFDPRYYPCGFCYAKPLDKCGHSLNQRKENQRNHKYDKLNVIETQTNDIMQYCRDFTGIITIDVTPPRTMYHPLIQVYSESENKVIGTLNPIKEVSIPSNILHEAILHGYVVTRIYRGDRYQLCESVFRNGLLGDLYLSKMKNAGAIDPENHARVIQTFQDKFKIDCSDIANWTSNPTLKAIAKGPPTAAWGKHAETPDHVKDRIVQDDNEDDMYFYKELLLNHNRLTEVRSVGPAQTMFSYQEARGKRRPDLHNTYLPVAVFVTAYGRLKLWRELNKLSERVVMYDTDSIIYACNTPDCSEYHIEEGDCLGDWETEDDETNNGGIMAFFSLGPKSYCTVFANGKYVIKIKGVSIKHSHSAMLTPEVMKSLILSKRPGSVPRLLQLPQMTFDYTINAGITTRMFRKNVQFNEEFVKGVFNWDDFRAYPYGYEPGQ